ncbi:MAG: hypothetical protein GX428_08330 [Candidatus Atribacteria bacterium]|nr:hypothetical protein [Candidatus Atribacteria bacterium]
MKTLASLMRHHNNVQVRFISTIIFGMFFGILAGCQFPPFPSVESIPTQYEISSLQQTPPTPTGIITAPPTSTTTPAPTSKPTLNKNTPQITVTNSDPTSEPYDPFLKWPEVAGEEVIIHYDFSRMSVFDVKRFFETSGADFLVSENGLTWTTGGQQSESWIRPDPSIVNSIDDLRITNIMVYFSLHKTDNDNYQETHDNFFPESNMFIDFLCETGPESYIVARVSTGATKWRLSIDFEHDKQWDRPDNLATLEDESEMYYIELFSYNTSSRGEQSFYEKQILLEYDDSPLDFSRYISGLDQKQPNFSSSAKAWNNFDCSNPKFDKIGFWAKLQGGINVTIKDLYIVGTKK